MLFSLCFILFYEYMPTLAHKLYVSQCIWYKIKIYRVVNCFFVESESCIIYRVIHKYLLDFRALRYSSRDDHAEGEHVNRGRETPNFGPTLQMLDCSFLLCLSSLLCSRVRKFRGDLWITLYIFTMHFCAEFYTSNSCNLLKYYHQI
jgi:hypothetical protein